MTPDTSTDARLSPGRPLRCILAVPAHNERDALPHCLDALVVVPPLHCNGSSTVGDDAHRESTARSIAQSPLLDIVVTDRSASRRRPLLIAANPTFGSLWRVGASAAHSGGGGENGCLRDINRQLVSPVRSGR